MDSRWLAIGVAMGAVSLTAHAASPFDGAWKGSNCYSAPVTMSVADGAVSGNMATGRQAFPFHGKIAADGTFNGGWMNGKFSGGHFQGSYIRQAGQNASIAGQPCEVVADLSR